MSDNDDTFPAPGDSQEETVGEALAGYLGLVEETIRAQVTDDDIRDRASRAVDLAASVRDRNPGHIRGRDDFSDRRLLLAELAALMGDPQQGPVVLAGPGGTGKTTVATALAERARALGQDVWWVSASNPVTLLRGLTAVARQLGEAGDVNAIARDEAGAADRFWRLLENASSEWLLVFDEADDPRVLAAGGSPAGVQDLTGWVRSSARGLALVTSREADPRMWEAARLLRVGELLEADAAAMLLALAPAAGEEREARALARRLGRHPLSLRLAGSFLHSQAAQGATFAAYERTLDEQERADLRERPGRHVPAVSVPAARALELSLGGLAQQGIPQTRPVLQVASCYAPAPIPVGLLNARSLTETGLLADSGDPSPIAEGRAQEALRELQITGILEPADGGVALHAVIIEAGRASMGGPGLASARIRHAAIELIHGCTAKLPYEDPESWPQYLLLGPHLLCLLDIPAGEVDREHLGLLIETTARATGAFNISGMSRAGIILGERALARSGPLGAEHRAVLRVRHAMTWAVAYHGDLSTAEAWYRENLQTQLRVLGPEDHDVLFSRHELAWVAACRGDWATAEVSYREVLDDSVRILGPDDPGTLLTRHELGWSIANQERSRLGEAREILDAVLSDRRRVLGAEHPRTLATLHELAWISAQEGQWEQAEAAYRELLVLRVRVLGEDHQDTMVIRHELAWVAARRGRTAEAESRYTDVLDSVAGSWARSIQTPSPPSGHGKSSAVAESSTHPISPESLTVTPSTEDSMTIQAEDLMAAVDELVPADCPLMVHVSLRSLGTLVAGGADTLLDALLTRGRTVLASAFTEPQFGLPAPAALRPARNGVDYGKFPAEPPLPEGAAYTPGCGLINASLGVFPATLIKRGGAVRGDHPLNSFAAFGPQAEELIAAQSPADVYGPIRELAARAGRILLIGVGLNRMTAIHLAERQSGRRLFLRWAKATDGRVCMAEVGSCSEGFPRLEPVLRRYARTTVVGDSRWQAFTSGQVLDAATTAIREDQGVTHCGDSDCLLCRDSIAGGPFEVTSGGQFSDLAPTY